MTWNLENAPLVGEAMVTAESLGMIGKWHIPGVCCNAFGSRFFSPASEGEGILGATRTTVLRCEAGELQENSSSPQVFLRCLDQPSTMPGKRPGKQGARSGFLD